MEMIAHEYAKRGYEILLPDLRACGRSDGKYLGMGWLDRKDLILWIDKILEKDTEAQVVLHGISMGGAAVMMTSGEVLPKNVAAVIEDCGYTSVWDIFADELSFLFHLPRFPLMHMADFFSRLRAGYSFYEASSLKQIQKSKTPTLFIHGSKDCFVHTEMVYPLYEACPAKKELLLVEGAGHGNSYLLDSELYFQTVFSFLGEENHPGA